MSRLHAPGARGFSLIEMMIAMVLGLILILGLVQVFAASRASYALSEGLSRVQENGRFAMDFLQRDIRMAGHFGCANDQFRKSRPDLGLLESRLTPAALDFSQSLQGYEASGTAPGATVNLLSDAQMGSPGSWAGSPALPSFITGAVHKPLPGSDVLVIRYLAGDGVPVTEVSGNTIKVDPARWSVLTQEGVGDPGLFGIADCTYADVFQATSAAAGTITAAAGGLNGSAPDFSRYTAHPAGQTAVYRAEAVAYYVARGAAGGPSLFRVRYRAAPGGSMTTDEEEVVEGIESMQLLYGQDPGPVNALTGHVAMQNTAASLGSTSGDTPEERWRRVGQVRVGLLARSPDRSSARQATANPSALGTSFAPSGEDARYRATYESTIALRNRLYGAQ